MDYYFNQLKVSKKLNYVTSAGGRDGFSWDWKHNGNIIWNWRTAPSGFARLANRARVTLTLGRTLSGMEGVVYRSTPPPRA